MNQRATVQKYPSSTLPTSAEPHDYTTKLQGMVRAALAMSSTDTLEETLAAIAEQARSVIGAHQAFASFCIDQRWEEAISTASFSDKYADYRNFDDKPDGSGRVSLVCERNQPCRMTQEELVERGFDSDSESYPALSGWLAVPLIDRKGRNLGLLQLSDKYQGEFTEEDEALLVELAQLASVAAENARLRDERVMLLLREHTARAEAEEAVKARDIFVSIASHELKTPLTTLRLQTDLLSRTAGKLDPELRQRLEGGVVVLRRQLDRLEALVGELLDVSRISSGHLELHLEPLDFAQLVEETVSRFAETARAAKCAITIESSGPVAGSWDKMRLDQVVTNLLSNAIKYGAGKPVELRIESSLETATLRVRDYGIGIAQEAQGRLFRRFERLVSDRHYGGLGLGLWIVREIVEQLGGSIHVESQLGEGSTFIVELPLGGIGQRAGLE